MLTDADIALIGATRKEMTHNRQTLITIAYEGAGTVDDVTGEVIGGKDEKRDVMSVVTEISSGTGAGVDRIIVGGVEVEKGDIWLSIDFEAIADIAGKLDKLRYDGIWYAVMASDKKGLGAINRVEVLGRVLT